VTGLTTGGTASVTFAAGGGGVVTWAALVAVSTTGDAAFAAGAATRVPPGAAGGFTLVALVAGGTFTGRVGAVAPVPGTGSDTAAPAAGMNATAANANPAVVDIIVTRNDGRRCALRNQPLPIAALRLYTPGNGSPCPVIRAL
jgi:hypothetical protein